MTELVFSEALDSDTDSIIALWQACGLTRPWNDPHNDIAFARTKPTSTMLVGRSAEGQNILSTVMVGHDGHRGWVYTKEHQ